MDVTKLLLLSSKLEEIISGEAWLFYFFNLNFHEILLVCLHLLGKQDRSIICSILPKFDRQLFVDLCVFHKLRTGNCSDSFLSQTKNDKELVVKFWVNWRNYGSSLSRIILALWNAIVVWMFFRKCGFTKIKMFLQKIFHPHPQCIVEISRGLSCPFDIFMAPVSYMDVFVQHLWTSLCCMDYCSY